MDANTYYFTLGELSGEWFQDHKNSGIRLGQYIINSGRLADIIELPCPEIFYEVDPIVVVNKLMALAPLTEKA